MAKYMVLVALGLLLCMCGSKEGKYVDTTYKGVQTSKYVGPRRKAKKITREQYLEYMRRTLPISYQIMKTKKNYKASDVQKATAHIRKEMDVELSDLDAYFASLSTEEQDTLTRAIMDVGFKTLTSDR